MLVSYSEFLSVFLLFLAAVYRIRLTIVRVFTNELNNRYSIQFIQLEIEITRAVSCSQCVSLIFIHIEATTSFREQSNPKNMMYAIIVLMLPNQQTVCYNVSFYSVTEPTETIHCILVFLSTTLGRQISRN